MGYLGFDHYNSCDKLWKVYYRGGTSFVHAPSEVLAIQRYVLRYPDREIIKVEKA